MCSAFQAETTKMTNSTKSIKWVSPDDMYGELFQAVQLGILEKQISKNIVGMKQLVFIKIMIL